MLLNDGVYLGTPVETIEYGETIVTYLYQEVPAISKSIRQKEWYESRLLGLKPELMFEMRASEYYGETRLKYLEKEYEIVRTFEKDGLIELICSSISNGT
jgi:hypothetical protein